MTARVPVPHDRAVRRDRFRSALEKAGLDGFAVTKSEHLNYLFGFRGSAGMAWVGPREAALIVDSRYIEQAAEQTDGCRPTLARDSVLETFRELLREVPAAAARRIGFESAHVSHDWFLTVRAWEPSREWTPSRDLLERQRTVKDASEILAMENAFAAAATAYRKATPLVSPGMSEKEAAALLELEMRRAGAEAAAFETIVASGPRSSLPHGVASDRLIGDGEQVLIDFGVRLDAYNSDLTRILLMPGARLPEIYAVVRDAQRAAIDAVAPGMPAGQVDRAARSLIEKAGYGDFFGHSTGHGLGLEVHELPRISRQSDEPLQVGMVFTVEPGIYLPGRVGVRLEEAVTVTETGCRLLSGHPI